MSDGGSKEMKGWGPASEEATWSIVSSETGQLYMKHNGTGGKEEICPICVLLLESMEGQALFAKYMYVDVFISFDGEEVITRSGWRCEMCGAKGEGQTPEFHGKPVR